MTGILTGLKNFLQLINDNWTLIIIVVGLAITLYRKIKTYLSKSNDEKIKLAWEVISQTMLAYVSDAEKDYLKWKKAGAIKRQQVIERIFNDYPILKTVTQQEDVIVYLDHLIDEALKTMRKIFEDNGQTLLEENDDEDDEE